MCLIFFLRFFAATFFIVDNAMNADVVVIASKPLCLKPSWRGQDSPRLNKTATLRILPPLRSEGATHTLCLSEPP